jgi:endonuclease YncB( thermonuclease family)
VRRPLLVLAALALVLVAAPAAADAAKGGPCLAGLSAARCPTWTGKVVSVNDGDTIGVDVDGDGTRRSRRIRFIGIQAMEQTVYSARRRQGDCHAVEATLRLESLVRRGKRRVRLAAEDPFSTSQRRLLRTVAVKVRGRWRDLGATLVSEGLALWWPSTRESVPNIPYGVLAQKAIAAQRGLFRPGGCGAGPAPTSPLKLWANWDADGDDSSNADGEWIKVRNLDPVTTVPLGGWYVRDSGLRRFTFPAGASIPPGGTVMVDVGTEGDGIARFPWRLRYPVLENPGPPELGMGDGAYLFDPLGNIRASMVYPCRYACSDPLMGAVAVEPHPRGTEYVTLRNVSAGPVDLQDHQLKSPPYGYDIGADSVLGPGEAMRVMTGGAPEDDTRLLKHWGLAKRILNDGGDVVRLVSYTDLTLGCAAWGSRAC